MGSSYLIDNPPRRSQYRARRRATPSGVIAVHTAENAPDFVAFDGGAEAVARFIRDRSDPGSYHNLADSDSWVNLVPYTAEAFHDGTGTNPHSFGLSVATRADVWPWAPQRWRDGAVEQAAQAAADYARWVKRTYGITIPARTITAAQARARVPGFTTHAELDPTRRSDPGRAFPWSKFLQRYAELMGQATEDPKPNPTPTPVGPTPQEGDMFLAVDRVGFFAVVDGVPTGLETDLAGFGKILEASPKVPLMVLSEKDGRKQLNELLNRHAATLAVPDLLEKLLAQGGEGKY